MSVTLINTTLPGKGCISKKVQTISHHQNTHVVNCHCSNLIELSKIVNVASFPLTPLLVLYPETILHSCCRLVQTTYHPTASEPFRA